MKAALAPSLSATFRLAVHGKILVEHIGGSSAVNLQGRFTYVHEGIARMVEEKTSEEEQANQGPVMPVD